MKQDDWYGMGASLLLHLLLLLAFGILSLGVSEPEPLGYIEVDFGPVALGQQVQRAVEDQPATEEEPDQEPEEEVEEEAAPPKEAKPVELPDPPEEIIDEEQVQTSETETIAPSEQNNTAEVVAPEPDPEPEPVKPLGGGATDGDTGEPEGDPGPGEDEKKTAPFNIEGLNRSTVYAPLPRNTVSANVDIKVRVTVNPQGRVVRIFPVQKGNPSLERVLQDLLKSWRFNALPSNAPQVNQTGYVTFRFVAE